MDTEAGFIVYRVVAWPGRPGPAAIGVPDDVIAQRKQIETPEETKRVVEEMLDRYPGACVQVVRRLARPIGYMDEHGDYEQIIPPAGRLTEDLGGDAYWFTDFPGGSVSGNIYEQQLAEVSELAREIGEQLDISQVSYRAVGEITRETKSWFLSELFEHEKVAFTGKGIADTGLE